MSSWQETTGRWETGIPHRSTPQGLRKESDIQTDHRGPAPSLGLFCLLKPLRIFGVRTRLEKRIQPAKTLRQGKQLFFSLLFSIQTADLNSSGLKIHFLYPVFKKIQHYTLKTLWFLTIKKDRISLTSQLHLVWHRNYDPSKHWKRKEKWAFFSCL